MADIKVPTLASLAIVIAIITASVVISLRATRGAVSYTHLRAHETVLDIVCRLLLEKKKNMHIDSESSSIL